MFPEQAISIPFFQTLTSQAQLVYKYFRLGALECNRLQLMLTTSALLVIARSLRSTPRLVIAPNALTYRLPLRLIAFLIGP
jgi:hypothetical protein